MWVAAPSPSLLGLLMTETQERFLRTVLTRVALDSVVELHLFPPIRRGTLETGVAVIVTRLPAPSLVVLEDDADVDADAEADTEAAGEAEPEADAVEAYLGERDSIEAGVECDTLSDESDDSPYADEGSSSVAEMDAEAIAVVGAVVGAVEIIELASRPSPRMRILTASYRHTIKGVERGKWTADVQEEADAPLEAVELVLRGVRHRSTEPADPELISLDALAALIAPVAVAPAA